eukprot:g60860.t1
MNFFTAKLLNVKSSRSLRLSDGYLGTRSNFFQKVQAGPYQCLKVILCIFQPSYTFSVLSTPFHQKKIIGRLANGLMPRILGNKANKGWVKRLKGTKHRATSATSKRHVCREKVEKQAKRAKVAHENAEKRGAEEREKEEQETRR